MPRKSNWVKKNLDAYEKYFVLSMAMGFIQLEQGINSNNREIVEMCLRLAGIKNPWFLLRETVRKLAAALSRKQGRQLFPELDEDLERTDDADDIVMYLSNNLKNNVLKSSALGRKLFRGFQDWFKAFVENEIARIDYKDSLHYRRLENIRRVFGLTAAQARVLHYKFYYLYLERNRLEYIQSDYTGMARVLGLTPSAYLAANRRLVKMGILNTMEKPFRVSTFILNYLEHENPNADLASETLAPLKGTSYPLRTFPVDAADTQVLKGLLKSRRGVQILFYGKPGTGKTEFAISLVKSAGRRAMMVRQPENYTGSHTERVMAACYLAGKHTILVIDEADSILNTGGGDFFTRFLNNSNDKGWLNEFMDSTQTSIIWIVNSVSGIEESTRRRFAYSLRFKAFSRREREASWKTQLSENKSEGLLAHTDVARLADRYNVSAAGIALAIRAAQTARETGTMDIPPARAAEMALCRHLELTTGQSAERSILPITPRYDIGFLNTEPDAGTVARNVQSACGRIYSGASESGLNILLYGTPGTGKTEFVKHLADICGLKLAVRRFSDLESKYVGECEQNIAQAFEDAARDQSILFIDEADSLFTGRKETSQSWEVSRTNEMLTRMENFRGVFVCATNLPDIMDSAVMRRFAWKVEFHPVRPADRLKLFTKYFVPKGARLSQRESALVNALEGLTPGDCEALRRRLQFEEPRTHDYGGLARELAREIELRKGRNAPKIGY